MKAHSRQEWGYLGIVIPRDTRDTPGRTFRSGLPRSRGANRSPPAGTFGALGLENAVEEER